MGNLKESISHSGVSPDLPGRSLLIAKARPPGNQLYLAGYRTGENLQRCRPIKSLRRIAERCNIGQVLSFSAFALAVTVIYCLSVWQHPLT